jgi:hypothetical protein
MSTKLVLDINTKSLKILKWLSEDGKTMAKTKEQRDKQ